ncbi:MAG: SDR family NAD(P)-dependent oxidoreductase, partial [Deltaproteobacteria bacterium]|nr:SDR family NAD(P)-dependent oxidoreductase [Deltaproteobacteria bacterium]
ISVEFPRAIKVGEEASCWVKHQDSNRVGIELLTRGARAASITIDYTPSRRTRSELTLRQPPGRRACRTLTADEAATAAGSLDLYLDVESATALFPNLMRLLSPRQVAEVLATTRLVGMECPGLHSVYQALDVVFSAAASVPGALQWNVTRFEKRFGLFLMNVETPGMKGIIRAFFRPLPQQQADLDCLCGQVDRNEFAGQRALVIGGSRGLGEVTAKLLAAGGADVKITYYEGSKDARRVVDDIVSHGGTADCTAFDVLKPAQHVFARFGPSWAPTHLYYFATPFIFDAVKGVFSPQLYQRFCDYYVTGFLNTVNAARNHGPDLQMVFYPSSIAVDDLPLDMGEYAAAKMAGEVLCRFLEKANSGLRIHKPRLPRTATDQTVSLL